jgi:hypothetical protein
LHSEPQPTPKYQSLCHFDRIKDQNIGQPANGDTKKKSFFKEHGAIQNRGGKGRFYDVVV